MKMASGEAQRADAQRLFKRAATGDVASLMLVGIWSALGHLGLAALSTSPVVLPALPVRRDGAWRGRGEDACGVWG